jgi:bifunctional non-homologous end joining protein LigD
MSTRSAESISIGGRRVSVSNLDKSLYPSGFTKGQVIDYYARVAPAMLPHLQGRAVTWKRYPNGTDQQFFFEKRCPSYAPQWVDQAEVVGSTTRVSHCVVNDLPTLIWAANLAALEFHVPMARVEKPDRPTAVVFDFDPGAPATLIDCLKLGLRVQKILADRGLECFPKTSGGKGLHLYVPLNTATTMEKTKAFARAMADELVRLDPEHVTANMSKALRAGKIFVDWSQNDPQKTTVCAYSLRALESPSVSTPVSWDEVRSAVKAKKPERLRFTPEQVLKRLEKNEDPFQTVEKLKQKLPKP